MKQQIWRAAILGFSLIVTMFLAPAPGRASHEAFAVYETWTSAPAIRADRWVGSGDAGHDVVRELNQFGTALRMRFRREGGTTSNVGATGFFSNRLAVAQPLSVDQVEADIKFASLTVTGCPANATPSTARAGIDLNRFSDLDPAVVRAPGNLTGDYIGRIQAARTSNSLDPPGILTITALLFRCNNAACSTTTTVSGPVTLGQVQVGGNARLRLIWDDPMNQFLAGLDGNSNVSLPYPASANKRPANVPFGTIRIQHLPANCTAASGGPTVADAEIEVRNVLTNASAVIPSGNRPPVAVCADVTAAADATCHANASVNNGSFDPDGDPITLAQLPAGPYNLRSTPVTLTVTDDKGAADSCSATVTVVDVTPPSVTCPAPQTLECTGPDGAVLSFTAPASDNCSTGITPSCAPPSGSVFPPGNTTDTCTATDGAGNQSMCSFAVNVVDTTPPVIESMAASPNVLWPPNHRMVAVNVALSVSDGCDPAPSCRVTSVTSNEPVDGLGDGHTAADWEISGNLAVKLRAERSGRGSGRVYTITALCTDASGNSSTQTTAVSVPHDQGKK